MPFPFSGSSDAAGQQEGEMRVLGLDDGEMESVFEALSSSTARSVLRAIHDSPATASELADRTDNSLQTVAYHLDSLVEADLVRVADTAYSEKGTEMDVYAPAEDPVVVFVGTEDRKTGLLDLLGRLAVVAGILVLVSAWIFDTRGGGRLATDGGSLFELVFAVPGLGFLAGGLFVLAFVVVWWIWT